MKLTLSTGCIEGHDVTRTSQIAAEAGLKGIEILLQYKKEPIVIDEINRTKRKYGLEISFVHAPFFQPRFPAYVMHPQKVAELLMCSTFEIASKIDARGVVVHPFPAFFKLNYTRKLMANILKNQKHSDIIVAVENLEKRRLGPFCLSPYCLRTGEELYTFVCKYNYHITFDIAHCASYAIEPKHFYRCFRDRIVNIHLSDYEAFQCHYPIGNRTVNLEEFISCLHEYNYDGYLCLETDPRYESKIFEGIKKLKEWIN